MAFDPSILSYTIRDELGTEASVAFYISYDGTVETVDGLTGQWLLLGAQLDAVTGGQITGGSVKIPVSSPGTWKTAPVAGARVEQTAILNFSTANSKKREGFSIPGLRDTLISGGKVLVASGAVKTLVDALVSGFTNGNYDNALGQALTTAVDAVLSFRKHRKQLSRESFESLTGV